MESKFNSKLTPEQVDQKAAEAAQKSIDKLVIKKEPASKRK